MLSFSIIVERRSGSVVAQKFLWQPTAHSPSDQATARRFRTWAAPIRTSNRATGSAVHGQWSGLTRTPQWRPMQGLKTCRLADKLDLARTLHQQGILTSSSSTIKEPLKQGHPIIPDAAGCSLGNGDIGEGWPLPLFKLQLYLVLLLTLEWTCGGRPMGALASESQVCCKARDWGTACLEDGDPAHGARPVTSKGNVLNCKLHRACQGTMDSLLAEQTQISAKLGQSKTQVQTGGIWLQVFAIHHVAIQHSMSWIQGP